MSLLRHLATAALVALMLTGLALPYAHAVTISWVTVGDAGNTADGTGYGAVLDEFRIMQFEWTNSQYVEFLNAVDPSGTNPNGVYKANMGSNARGGISFTDGAASGSKYAVRSNMGNKPVNFVTWFDAARVANWLENGQGNGSTETGAYTLNNATTGNAPAVNPGASYFLPTENQWYKAAYFKGGFENAGYWTYATRSTSISATFATATGDGTGGTNLQANYGDNADWNSLNGNVTTVGTNGRDSSYGTFDMSGNVWEWNDLSGGVGQRGLRGGSWNDAASVLATTHREQLAPDAFNENNGYGFRLAAVPEPATYAMALAGIACGGFSMWRRRKRA